MKQYATYLRVSTQRQGAQGLGISAQRNMCDNFIKQNNGEQVREFMDVESGTHRDRKGLWQAIDYCKKNGCSLVIAKLDRLARDVEFTFKVINTGIDIHFTDMPVVNSMILGVFAAVAQYEREMVSTRTKQALAVKKAQGCRLGRSNPKYKETYNNKPQEEKERENMERGKMKSLRFIEARDQQVFMKVLKKVFPECTNGDDIRKWNWEGINCKPRNSEAMRSVMAEYKELDGNLFRKWDFTKEYDSRKRLITYVYTIKRSLFKK